MFPGGSAGWGFGIVTAVTQVAAVAWVWSLAWELLNKHGQKKKTNKQKKKKQKKKKQIKTQKKKGAIESVKM